MSNLRSFMSKFLIQNNEQIEEATVGREFEPIIFALKKRYLSISLLNGGVDVARFELFKKYYEHLNDTPVIEKICYLIYALNMTA